MQCLLMESHVENGLPSRQPLLDWVYVPHVPHKEVTQGVVH